MRIALGSLVVLAALPFVMLAGLFSWPMKRTPEDVAQHIRAMLDGTIDRDHYDEFSSVAVSDPRLDAIVTRACHAYENWNDDSRAILSTLLAELDTLKA